jgi:hypothetical protein
MIWRGIVANVGVVRPVGEASAVAVKKIDDGEFFAGSELSGEIDAVGHVTIESGGMEGYIPQDDAGKLAWMVEQQLRGGMAAGEKETSGGEDGQGSSENAKYFH